MIDQGLLLEFLREPSVVKEVEVALCSRPAWEQDEVMRVMREFLQNIKQPHFQNLSPLELENYRLSVVRSLFLPSMIILPTEDLYDTFVYNCQEMLEPKDIREVFYQVSDFISTHGHQAKQRYANQLPEFNRMVTQILYTDTQAAERVRNATAVLFHQLFDRIAEYGAFFRGQFPYVFDHFRIKDALFVLFRF